MEGNGRWLPWIAIALSAVALVVSLSGRAQSRWQGYMPRGAYGPQAAPGQLGPMGPRGWDGPQAAPGQPGQAAPQPGFGPQWRRGPGPDQRFSNEFRQPGPFGRPRFFGPGLFFFLPFLLLGLIKLAFVVLLIWLGLRLIRGRGFGGPWGRGPSGYGGPDQPNQPGPEQPPYTGDTQQM